MEKQIKPITVQQDSDKAMDFLYDIVQDIILESHRQVQNSQKLFQLGSKDEITDFIKELTGDPFDIVTSTCNKQIFIVRKLMQHFVAEFLSTFKEKIEKAYIVNKDDYKLHYAIILKKDNYKERALFYTFLQKYDNSGMSNSFPIIFQFVSAKLDKKLNKVEEISFT